MEYLDTTIIATALPQMAQSFSVGPNEVSLGMTAYMLTLAVFIPISGWIADRFGSRPCDNPTLHDERDALLWPLQKSFPARHAWVGAAPG